MKVLHVVRQFYPAVGGLEASVLNLATIQRHELGIDTRVLTLDRVFGQPGVLKPVDDVDGIPVRRIPWRGSSRYPLAPSVLRYLRSVDVIHVHAIDFFFDFLAVTKPVHRKFMVASTHGGFFHTSRTHAGKRIWFNVVTRASVLAYGKVIACSHSDAALFSSVAGRRMILIENGIDQKKYSSAASQLQTRTIICFGRYASHKRLEDVISLVGLLRTHHRDWKLILAGRDADQTSAQLTCMAVAAGVGDAVEVVADPSDDTLRMLMGRSSYYASLSAYEGFGLAAVEAMSAGLMPILSDIAPFKTLLADAAPGVLVSVDDMSSGAKRVEATVLIDNDKYAQRRFAVMQSVARYRWDDVAREYAAVYDAVSGNIRPVPLARAAGQAYE
ncbi:MAG: glycosyltransferase family 4 protein [Acidocella sp.]|nr:glycosyltransferase family 4 protein [Acidocella sp.]